MAVMTAQFDSHTTADNVNQAHNKKILLASALYHAGVAGLVGWTALHTEDYNHPEWWSDVAAHLLNTATCTSLALVPTNASLRVKTVLDMATSATILVNHWRISTILTTGFFGTATIPLRVNGIDLLNHWAGNLALQRGRLTKKPVSA